MVSSVEKNCAKQMCTMVDKLSSDKPLGTYPRTARRERERENKLLRYFQQVNVRALSPSIDRKKSSMHWSTGGFIFHIWTDDGEAASLIRKYNARKSNSRDIDQKRSKQIYIIGNNYFLNEA